MDTCGVVQYMKHDTALVAHDNTLTLMILQSHRENVIRWGLTKVMNNSGVDTRRESLMNLEQYSVASNRSSESTYL